MGQRGGKSGAMEKTFQDAVHGAITLHPLCVRVMDTPHFQRLRHIKVVGSCYFVFPAAAQNRFEHCLGFFNGQWCQILFNPSSASMSSLACLVDGDLGVLLGWPDGARLPDRQPELNITAADVLCVQLAGLCHDLGHGPYSHLWERFVNQARPKKHWVHESTSTKMFDHLIETNNLFGEFEKYDLKEQDIIFIKEMIHSPPGDGSDWCYKGRPKDKAFLYQIVANKQTGVDVDKWDYFLRDSHSLGMKVTFDYHRLIKFSRVISVEGEGPQICIQDKECSNVYDMFHARRVLHRTAYQHRVAKTIDYMFIDALLKTDKHITYLGADGVRYPLADVCDDMVAYTKLTDEVFQRILYDEGSHPELEHAQHILNNIYKRQLYLCVGHTRPNNPDTTGQDLEEALERSIPKDSLLTPQDLIITVVDLNYGMKDQNPVELVYFYNKNSPTKGKKIKKEESTMLPERFQEKIFRVLCRSSKEDKFKQAQEALQIACQELNMKKPHVEFFPSLLSSPKKHR
ncbi:Deoxynucleoside triphosphate triphosphohydrolase SAMHD1 [Chionoecetes opilio]|uniref:Deoxynucleoside triphosphate triphosphohydrolase SAMHD1 n=1 Tax=Chionoecetes opilio TaxID=41210 RepID=A0A8J4XUR1_CHIOP|nr:Deoxynucleoside triphosphate triphosphohydrolase SAMHD1 [Chionoecetes opilio]